MTFDDWLNEVEVFSTRQERLESDVDFAAVMTGNLSHNLARRRLYTRLEAAYIAGGNLQKKVLFKDCTELPTLSYKYVTTEYTCTKCFAYLTDEKQVSACIKDYCPSKDIKFGAK